MTLLVVVGAFAERDDIMHAKGVDDGGNRLDRYGGSWRSLLARLDHPWFGHE
jgi:hypothetical protein